MIAPKEFGIRPRKVGANAFRKENYWTTQKTPEFTVSYGFDSKIPVRSRSEERVRPCGCPLPCSGAAARKDLREYLLTSTLHGLRYIGEGRLTWFERVFWLLAFSFSLVCASFFILNIYDKWRSAPMIVSINPQSMRLRDLPFPAVTICNVNKAKSRAEQSRVEQSRPEQSRVEQSRAK